MKSILISAVSVFALYSTASFGICSKEEAIAAVNKACSIINEKGNDSLKDIAKFRFCGSNYVWIQDTDPKIADGKSPIKMVQHPVQRRLDGGDLTQHKDEDGVFLFIEFDKMAKQNKDGGWVDYKWKKAGAETATPKTSFVKLCGDKVPWIAGAGVWKDDLK